MDAKMLTEIRGFDVSEIQNNVTILIIPLGARLIGSINLVAFVASGYNSSLSLPFRFWPSARKVGD